MSTLIVDGRQFDVNPELNVLEACLSLEMDLPYFCWHPALGSVGACRQCAVKQYRDDKDTRGKIVMACMTPIVDGLRISIADPEARKFRASIIEGMMENHPHDCPVCDEGGECHLQDMTVMTGHNYRGYRFPKRTFRNQNLGPFLHHEMNRCIQCYRCVRFYREYAGGTDFNVFKLRDLVYFGRAQDGVLENEFSGNLVEVCPTGVFTDATLRRHYTRKWDLTMAPSICVHCGLGCNTTAAERYGVLRRIVNRYNGAVNGYFLCDRGRYGYEFVNSDRRIRAPGIRENGILRPVTAGDALVRWREILDDGRPALGIGSPRASLEANFALRALVGPERFSTGMAAGEADRVTRMLEVLRTTPARTPSMREAEGYDAVLVLGEDVTNTAPRLALSLRQSARQQTFAEASRRRIPAWQDHAVRELAQQAHGPFFVASVCATRLDDVASECHRAAPDDLARVGFALAHEIDATEAPLPDLDPDTRALARRWAAALTGAERPLVVSGAGCGTHHVIEAAACVARALVRAGKPAGVILTMPECNSAGVAMLGGMNVDSALETARARPCPVIVLENDLFRRSPAAVVDGALEAIPHLVLLDSLETETAARAELVLPSGTFAESDGTLVNNEGRAQRFFRPIPPAGDVRESWRWLAALMETRGGDGLPWRTLDDVVRAISDSVPELSGVSAAAPPSDFRLDGAKIPREPHRYSGRTSMNAGVEVSEPRPPHDPDSALSFTMEGATPQPPAALLPFFWTPGWNSIQAVNKFQTEVGAALRGGDSGVRLLDGAAAGVGSRTGGIPPAFVPRPGEWLLVPLHHIHGSEILSSAAPAVAKLAPSAYLAMSDADARRLRVEPGDEVRVTVDGTTAQLPVRVVSSLRDGLAGVPMGLQGSPVMTSPVWGTIEKLP